MTKKGKRRGQQLQKGRVRVWEGNKSGETGRDKRRCCAKTGGEWGYHGQGLGQGAYMAAAMTKTGLKKSLGAIVLELQWGVQVFVLRHRKLPQKTLSRGVACLIYM
jgi:hypothetical protein